MWWWDHRFYSSRGQCITTRFCPAAAKSLQSCLTLCNPIEGRLPGPWDSLGKNTGVYFFFTLSFHNYFLGAILLSLKLGLGKVDYGKGTVYYRLWAVSNNTACLFSPSHFREPPDFFYVEVFLLLSFKTTSLSPLFLRLHTTHCLNTGKFPLLQKTCCSWKQSPRTGSFSRWCGWVLSPRPPRPRKTQASLSPLGII